MRTSRNLLAVAAGLIACITIVWLAGSIQGGERTYEVRPEITLPEYRTDAARAIDAYERMIDRYMSLTEGNLTRIGTDVQGAARKLESIERRLRELCVRMARIEKALGVGEPKEKPVVTQPKAKTREDANESGLAGQER